MPEAVLNMGENLSAGGEIFRYKVCACFQQGILGMSKLNLLCCLRKLRPLILI